MVTTIDLFKNATDFKVFKPGEEIFREGETGDVMYAIIEGEVEIAVKEKIVDTTGVGGIVGEMALIDNAPRSATARARIESKLVPIPRKRFEFLIQQTPFFAIQVMKIMSERVRKLLLATGK